MASTRINSPGSLREVKKSLKPPQKTPPKTCFWSFFLHIPIQHVVKASCEFLNFVFLSIFMDFFWRFFRDFFTKMKNDQN